MSGPRVAVLITLVLTAVLMHAGYAVAYIVLGDCMVLAEYTCNGNTLAPSENHDLPDYVQRRFDILPKIQQRLELICAQVQQHEFSSQQWEFPEPLDNRLYRIKCEAEQRKMKINNATDNKRGSGLKKKHTTLRSSQRSAMLQFHNYHALLEQA